MNQSCRECLKGVENADGHASRLSHPLFIFCSSLYYMADFKIPERKCGKRKRWKMFMEDILLRSEIITNSIFFVVTKSKTGRFSSIFSLLKVSSESGAKAIVGYQLRRENNRKSGKRKKKTSQEHLQSLEPSDVSVAYSQSAPATIGSLDMSTQSNIGVNSICPQPSEGLTTDLRYGLTDDIEDYPPAEEILEILNSTTSSDFSNEDSYVMDTVPAYVAILVLPVEIFMHEYSSERLPLAYGTWNLSPLSIITSLSDGELEQAETLY